MRTYFKLFIILFLFAGCTKYKELVYVEPNCSIQGIVKPNWFSYYSPNFFRRIKINNKSIYHRQSGILIFKDSKGNIHYSYRGSKQILFYKGKKYKSKDSYPATAQLFTDITLENITNNSKYNIKIFDKIISVNNSDSLLITTDSFQIKISIFSSLERAFNALFIGEFSNHGDIIFEIERIKNNPNDWPVHKN